MQLNLPPDLEMLIKKRLSSGSYTSVEDVLRRALEAQNVEESWTEEERGALSAHIEEGYLLAGRGEVIDGAQTRREIKSVKENWHQELAAAIDEGDASGTAEGDVFARVRKTLNLPTTPR